MRLEHLNPNELHLALAFLNHPEDLFDPGKMRNFVLVPATATQQ
jgi:hypothetical protein